MATGYKLPNGTKSTSGFDFSGRTEWSYLPSGSRVYTYVKAITGNGYIRTYNTGGISTSYPAAQYGQTSGAVYVRSGNNVNYAGSITTDNYANIAKSKTVVANSTTATGGSIGGASQVWESDGGADVTAEPASGFLVTAFSGYSGSLPSKTTVTQRIPYSGSASVAATFTQYYNVQFNSNGGSGSISKMENLLWNQYYNLPDSGMSRSGWTLAGWNTNSAGTGTHYALGANIRNLTTSAGGTVTLYAEWKQVTTRYDANGGSDAPAAHKGPVNETFALAAGCTPPTGYKFSQWKIGSQYYDAGQSYTATADATAFAQYTPNKYNIAFNVNGGSGSVTSMANLNYGTGYSLNSYYGSRTYYTFKGWARSKTATEPEFLNGATVSNLTATDNQTVTLYAVWQRNTRQVQVTNMRHSDAAQLTVVCHEDGSSRTATSEVWTFSVVEGYHYAFRLVYESKFLAHKWTFNGWRVPNGDILRATKVDETTLEYAYECTASSVTDFVGVFTQQAQYNIVVSVEGRIGAVPFVGPVPTAWVSPDEDSPAGWFGQDITVEYDMNGNEAMEFDSWTASSGGVPYATYDPASPQPMTFFLQGNTTLVVAFRAKTAQVAADVEARSAAVVGSSIASVVVQQYTTGKNSYGDKATFAANDLGDAHRFSGWFDAAGEPAPDSTIDGHTYTYRDRTYVKVLDGDIHLYARYCSPVDLYLAAPTDGHGDPLAHGTVYINDEGNDRHIQRHLEIGSTCRIAVETTDYFGGWYSGENPNFITDVPLQFDQSDEFVVEDGRKITAYVVNEQSYNYVALLNFDQREGVEDYDETLGEWSLNDGAATPGVEEVTRSQFESELSALLGYDYHAPADGTFLRVIGIKRLTVQAVANPSKGVGVYSLKWFAADDMTTALRTVQGGRDTIVANDYFVCVANYGVPAQRLVRAAYANGSEKGEGVIDIYTTGTPETHGERADDGSVSMTLAQGTEIAMSAVPKNGYKFVGWYYDANHLQIASREVVYRLVVPYDLTLYAVFAQDANAIYEWEGSSENKTMEWQSKTFVGTKPFNPSCARVDALGYPLTLEVGVFSSPHDAPRRTVVIHPKDQSARRLSLIRPERYFNVKVRADHEVDMIIVGTSMAGMNV